MQKRRPLASRILSKYTPEGKIFYEKRSKHRGSRRAQLDSSFGPGVNPNGSRQNQAVLQNCRMRVTPAPRLFGTNQTGGVFRGSRKREFEGQICFWPFLAVFAAPEKGFPFDLFQKGRGWDAAVFGVKRAILMWGKTQCAVFLTENGPPQKCNRCPLFGTTILAAGHAFLPPKGKNFRRKPRNPRNKQGAC